MTELKPCPFCGQKLVFDGIGYWNHPRNDCILAWLDRDYDAIFFEDNKENVAEWNRRAYDDARRSD